MYSCAVHNYSCRSLAILEKSRGPHQPVRNTGKLRVISVEHATDLHTIQRHGQ